MLVVNVLVKLNTNGFYRLRETIKYGAGIILAFLAVNERWNASSCGRFR